MEVQVVSQLRLCRPPPLLRKVHLDIKNADCVKKMMGVKFHITSYRVWTPQASKSGKIAPQTFNFLHEWLNWQGRLELIWCSFFVWMTFFVQFLVFEIWWILYFFLRDLAEIWRHFLLLFWVRGLTPPPPPHALHRGCALDTSRNRLTSTALFAKAGYAASLPNVQVSGHC